MKRLIATGSLLLAVSVAAVGCADKKKTMASNSVTDLGPQPLATATYPPVSAPAPTPVMSQPVSYDNAAPVAATPAVASTGGTYTVKKGDTLFAIARAKYGDGKQWKKIASANPGLTPQSLKVGQTITLP